MALRIDQDKARFRQIIRGKVRANLRKYISRGELMGRQGKDVVSIPLPEIHLPRFRFDPQQEQGVGSGKGQPGDPVDGEEGEEGGAGKAGDQAGEHVLEEELTIAELAEILGEELELPRIEPRGRHEIRSSKFKLSSIRRTGPESLRHFKRTYKEALKRQIASGTYNPERPMIVPVRQDRRYRSWRVQTQPVSAALILYMMDVSGSMGDEQKEMVRIESYWIDTWLRSQYQGLVSRYVIHDATAREVDRDTFFRTRESGGTIISSAYKLALQILDAEYPENEWNVYLLHFSDGDNWSSEDSADCVKLVREQMIPRSNLFCYGQVRSPYGSGQFIKDLREAFGAEPKVALSEIEDRDGIAGSIKDFLGRAADMPASRSVLPRYLREIQVEVEGQARSMGLDFFPVIFEILNYEEMNMVAAYGGFPTRYPHWRFGMEYKRLSKGYSYGLHKIYEMVINNNPCYAYLLEGNSTLEQKLVMAHVLAHCDFFKNNAWFAPTDRKMMDEMANHATQVARAAERYGQEQVETFLDACLSLENLYDPTFPFAPRPARAARPSAAPEEPAAEELPRLPAKSYMDSFINPQEYLDRQRRARDEQTVQAKRFPAQPRRDVMLFLLEHAPLERWQQNLLAIVRDEAYYYMPQGQTKIMNEGWATYWHSELMTKRLVKASEVIDYADHASMVLATSGNRLNPYKLGLELFRDIEERWNTGRFGKEWEECQRAEERSCWDRKTGLGREKIFQVRRTQNDLTFLDEFLTLDFCVEHNLFSFGYNAKRKRWEVLSREFAEVKAALLQQLTNGGHPIIVVEDGNYENKGELLLTHRHEGLDLDPAWGAETLAALARLWSRPANVITQREGKQVRLRHDGHELRTFES